MTIRKWNILKVKLRVCSRSGSVKFFCSPSGLFDSRGQIETKCESSRMPPLLKQWSTYSTPPVSTKPSIKPWIFLECRIRAHHVSSLDILFLSGYFVNDPDSENSINITVSMRSKNRLICLQSTCYRNDDICELSIKIWLHIFASHLLA